VEFKFIIYRKKKIHWLVFIGSFQGAFVPAENGTEMYYDAVINVQAESLLVYCNFCFCVVLV